MDPSETSAAEVSNTSSRFRSSSLKIDMFTHIMPKSYVDALQKMVPVMPNLWNLDQRFKGMDQLGEMMNFVTLGQPPIENISDPIKAVDLAKKARYAKFDETIDISVKLVHKSYQNIRGNATLPAGTGKEKKVLVLCKGDKQKEAQEAGADYVGAEDLIEKIKEGWIDFQAVVLA